MSETKEKHIVQFKLPILLLARLSAFSVLIKVPKDVIVERCLEFFIPEISINETESSFSWENRKFPHSESEKDQLAEIIWLGSHTAY